MRRRVLVVCGTRPEAIKLAPVYIALQEHPAFRPVLCVTAQHRQMLDQVLNVFQLEPSYDLNVMKPGQDLFGVTTAVLSGMKPLIHKEEPDLVVVQGDTTTAFAASLAAFYSRVPVAHVEAGLRTGMRYSPFPEEINRVMIGGLTTYHFAPTIEAKKNLLAEGIDGDSIWITGNTVIDALKRISERLDEPAESVRWAEWFCDEVGLEIAEKQRRIVLVTGHRRENFGDGIRSVCDALSTLALAYPSVDIVYPVHPNPNVVTPVRRLLGRIPNIHLIGPLDYEPFVFLMKKAFMIITDSGGVQEEAPFLGKPVLVTRENTERPEGVNAGTVRLVGTTTSSVLEAAALLLDDAGAYEVMAHARNPYGDGYASERIVRTLARMLHI